MKIDWWRYISSNNHKIITDYELLEIQKRIERAYKITELNKQEPIIIKDNSNNNQNNCQHIFQIRSINDEGKFYEVDADIKTCTCPDFNYRLLKCKHIIAAEFVRELIEGTAAA
jgi:predicted nucleic acid-binding Zn finger protein